MSLLLQLIGNGFVNGCLYALIAFSFSLIYNTTRILHIAHAAIYTISGYACYFLISRLHTSLPVAGLAAIVLAALLGILTERLLYAPLEYKKGSSLVALISSLGLYITLVNIVALLFGNDARLLRTEIDIPLHLGPVRFTVVQIVQALGSLLVVLAGLLVLRYSSIGRMFRAARDNPVLIQIMGISLPTVRLIAFSLGSALAALAAVLGTLDTGITPLSGMPLLLTGVVAIIIGGVNTFEGAVIGALLLGILQGFLVWQLPARWNEAFTYLLFIVFLLFRPYGLIGKRLRIEESIP